MSHAQTQHYTRLERQEIPDGVLIERTLAGDQSAFECLVSRYQLSLVCYIRSILKDDDALFDVLQHVLLQLYVSLPTLLTDVPIKAWLLRVARNRCLDELRRSYRRFEVSFSTLERETRSEDESLVESIPDAAPLPEVISERIDLHNSVMRAISTLSPKFRSIVYLRFFKQLTFPEIGRKLDMPESSVKTCFYRSLPQLRRKLAGSMNLCSVS